jgi:hypothetical protein
MKQAIILLVAALALFVGVQQNCLAAPVIFFGEDLSSSESTPLSAWPNALAAHDAFMANLTGVGTETFESFSAGTVAPITVVFPGAGTATLSGDGVVSSVPNGQTNGVGRYAISGTNFWETSQDFSLLFTQPQSAFGFYGVDIGDFGGQITLNLVDGTTTTLTVPNTMGSNASTGGSVLYYGFYDLDPSNAFTQITFGDTQAGSDFFAFDDFSIGTLEQVNPPPAIPEPTTFVIWSLLGAIAIAAGWRRGRKAA